MFVARARASKLAGQDKPVLELRETRMKRAAIIAVSASSALMATAALADNALYAARIGAVDAPAVAEFYESVFGMQLVLKQRPETFLNFGQTMAAAKANKAPPIIVTHRDSDAIEQPVGHLIFSVDRYAATAAAIKAAGGTISEPRKIAQSGDTIGVRTDPAGNKLELIELRK
jgi:predicted enzyme related to lactoylglutathione lyase